MILNLKGIPYLALVLFTFLLVNKNTECLDISLRNIQCEELSIYNELDANGKKVAQIDHIKQTLISPDNNKIISERNEYIFYPDNGLVKKKIEFDRLGVRFFYEYEQTDKGEGTMKLVYSKSIRPNDWDIKNILYS